MKFRKLIFWMHLVIGVAASLVILTMAGAGLLLSFRPQIIAAADRSIAGPGLAGIDPTVPRAGLEAIGQAVRAAFPEERITTITLRRDAREPVLVNLGRERTVLVHPLTAAMLGEGTRWRGFMNQVEQVHRMLALGPDGKAITGAASIALFVLVLSGLVLWWPRQWSRRALAAQTIPSLRLRGKARHFNWHNAFGFWAALPLLLSILTGVVMAYPWANNLLFRLSGNEPPVPRAAPAERSPGTRKGAGVAPAFRTEGLDKMWAAAVERTPAWQSAMLRFGDGPAAPVAMMLDAGNGARPDLRAQITFDARTGELQKWTPFASNNLGQQLRQWVKPLHTGEALGLPGQMFAAFTALAALILVWTGLGLALRRFRQRRSGTPVPTPDSASLRSFASSAETPTNSSSRL